MQELKDEQQKVEAATQQAAAFEAQATNSLQNVKAANEQRRLADAAVLATTMRKVFDLAATQVRASLLQAWAAKVEMSRVEKKLAMTKMVAVMQSGTPLIVAYRPQLTVPFQKWVQETRYRINKARLAMVEDALQGQTAEVQQLSEDMEEMRRREAVALEIARQRAQEEVDALKAELALSRQEAKKTEAERLRVVRTNKVLHDRAEEQVQELKLRNQRRIFVGLMWMRRRFKDRNMLLLLRNWMHRWRLETDPKSLLNRYNASAAQNVTMRAIEKQMRAAKDAAELALEDTQLNMCKAAKLQNEAERRVRQMDFLMLTGLYELLARAGASSCQWAMQVWCAVTQRRLSERQLQGEIEASRQETAKVHGEKLYAQDFGEEVQGKLLGLQERLVEAESENKELKTELFKKLKNAKLEVGELEASIQTAWAQAESAKELLHHNEGVLETTQTEKETALDIIAKQDEDLTVRVKAEERLAEMYDSAMEALSKERTDTHAFNTAVLKTHWLICKLHEVMRRCQVPDFMVGQKQEVEPEPEIAPMTDGVGVLKADEQMLDRVYHWTRKNMANIIAGGVSHRRPKGSPSLKSPGSPNRSKIDQRFREAAQNRATSTPPKLVASPSVMHPSKVEPRTAWATPVGELSEISSADAPLLSTEGPSEDVPTPAPAPAPAPEPEIRPDPDAALRNFLDTARNTPLAPPGLASNELDVIPMSDRTQLRSVDEWVERSQEDVAEALRHAPSHLSIVPPSPTSRGLGSPLRISTPPFEGNRHSPLPPISESLNAR